MKKSDLWDRKNAEELHKIGAWKLLQMFADGGGDAGGGQEGGDTAGGTAPDAGEAELRAAGVSEDGIKKWAKRNRRLTQAGTEPANSGKPAQETETGDANRQEQTPSEAGQTARKTLKEIIGEDEELKREYDTAMQDAVRGRLRKAKAAEENLKALEPALLQLAKGYGLDIENPDYKKLAEAMGSDDRFVEEAALRSGNTLEAQRKLDAAQVQAALDKRAERENAAEAHARKIVEQAKALQQKYPGFDLMRECENPIFERMIRPEGGATVEIAYNAIHHDELQRAAIAQAQAQTKTQTVNAIRAGQQRPSEMGGSQTAPADAGINPKALTRDQRAAIRRQVSEAAARGQHIRLEDIKL